MAKLKIRINERAKVPVIAIAIGLFTFVISYNVIYNSQHSRRKVLRAGIEDERRNIVWRKKIAELSNFKKQYKKYLYDTTDPSALRSSISSLARDAGVDIVSIQSQGSVEIGNYSRISVSLHIRCSYSQLGKFIACVESSPMLTVVDNIRLDGIPSGAELPNEAMADVSLSVNAYTSG